AFSNEPFGSTSDSTAIRPFRRTAKRAAGNGERSRLASVRLLMALTAAHFAQQQCRLDRGHRSLTPLVLAGAVEPTAVERLLLGVAGQDPEPYRHGGVEGDAGEAVRHRATHVVEVRSATADHRAQRDDRVVPLLREHLRGQRQLEGAGYPYQRRVLDLAVGE